MSKLIDELIHEGVLHTEQYIAAFRAVRRADFLHTDMQQFADENVALPIIHGQNISQPYTVAFMLEHLQPQPGDRILEVGCGSGWVTGLLAQIVGASGYVYAIDIIPQLVDLTQEHLRKYKFENIHLQWGNGWKGVPEHAPFNRIIVSAGAPKVPQTLVDELAHNGKLVVPVGEDIQELYVITKHSDGKLTQDLFPGFQFVPMVGDIRTKETKSS